MSRRKARPDGPPPRPAGPMPKLSLSLTYPREPGTCQACGWTDHPDELERWLEHDEADRETRTVVQLCPRCSATLVGPHPRLYRRLDKWEPHAGSMVLCAVCRFRSGLGCSNPQLPANGGRELLVHLPPVRRVHVCRSPRSQSGWVTLYTGPPIRCDGFAEGLAAGDC